MAKAALKAPTKTQILANIAEETELSKKDVAAVFDALAGEIAKAISRGGPWSIRDPRPLQDRPQGRSRQTETKRSQSCRWHRNLAQAESQPARS